MKLFLFSSLLVLSTSVLAFDDFNESDATEMVVDKITCTVVGHSTIAKIGYGSKRYESDSDGSLLLFFDKNGDKIKNTETDSIGIYQINNTGRIYIVYHWESTEAYIDSNMSGKLVNYPTNVTMNDELALTDCKIENIRPIVSK
ncbi:MAG: hypothetical protein HQK51_17810 [Oligoflexia bacterium]|nr:hypothetical protein [Oligoflexia bacterium]